ncbi:NIPA protein, partial [Amia calva]|nr:NIPA protein [Amia calva]
MLKCTSCEAFLCGSLELNRDINKYKERILELKKSLQTRHDKFCFWPDFPSPDRFWTLPISEPAVLFSNFLDRFKSACRLDLQLPSMKPDDLKNLSLSEDVLSVLLQLIEDELKREGGSPVKICAEPLSVQLTACIVALFGWSSSATHSSLHLPVLICSYCLRKVGLWNFHQIDGLTVEGDGSFALTSTPGQDSRGDRMNPTSASPCRMVLRSQDATRTQGSEHGDASPSPLVFRTRNRDSPSPNEESPSPVSRGKRPVTRSRVLGEAMPPGSEVPSSPQRRAKRSRLSSASSTDTPTPRSAFDPLYQHRDWCPWVSMSQIQTPGEGESTTDTPAQPQGPESSQPGWKAALDVFLSMRKSDESQGATSSQGLHDKTQRVLKLFRVCFPNKASP